MAAVAAEYEGRVNIVGIASNGQPQNMVDFVGRYGVEDIPHVEDVGGDIRASFGVDYQPGYAFINDDGTMSTIVSALGDEELRNVADALLAS